MYGGINYLVFRNLAAGFTRIEYLGQRHNDKAQICYIELVNNPYYIYEKNEEARERERLGLQSYWSWEHKLLKQEQVYFEQQLASIDAQIGMELDKFLVEEQIEEGGSGSGIVSATGSMNETIKKEIQTKYAKKKDFLKAGLQRAQFEEKIHLKQENYKRYDRMYTAFTKDMDMDIRKMVKG